jgi:hypothetical protein
VSERMIPIIPLCRMLMRDEHHCLYLYVVAYQILYRVSSSGGCCPPGSLAVEGSGCIHALNGW